MLFLPAASADSTITLTSPNAQHAGYFGSSVAINENDPIVVVGAPGETGNAGHAYVFDATDGSLIATLTSPNANAQISIYFFGSSVSISGTIAVVGAYDDTTNGLPTN